MFSIKINGKSTEFERYCIKNCNINWARDSSYNQNFQLSSDQVFVTSSDSREAENNVVNYANSRSISACLKQINLQKNDDTVPDDCDRTQFTRTICIFCMKVAWPTHDRWNVYSWNVIALREGKQLFKNTTISPAYCQLIVTERCSIFRRFLNRKHV